MEVYESNAKWTKILDSKDTHYADTSEESKADAEGVCRRLANDYGKGLKCGIRGECTKTWVTGPDGYTKVIYEKGVTK